MCECISGYNNLKHKNEAHSYDILYIYIRTGVHEQNIFLFLLIIMLLAFLHNMYNMQYISK